jgi:hypothetical protein
MATTGRVEMAAAATVTVAAHDQGAEAAAINPALQTVDGRGAGTERRTIVVPG